MNEDTMSDVERIFLKWSQNHSNISLSSSIIIGQTCENPTHGRGIYASNSIQEGEELIRVQKSTTIGMENPIIEDVLEKYGISIDYRTKTVLSLLYEMGQGEDSMFFGYTNILPKESLLPITWKAEDLKYLEGTAVNHLIDTNLVKSKFDSIKALMSENMNVWPSTVSTYDQFEWAYSILTSRAFEFKNLKQPVLLPIIDMSNHGISDVNAYINYDGEYFHLISTRDIVKGSEICISYGDLSSGQLLVKYGFLPQSPTSNDHLVIPSSWIQKTADRLIAEEYEEENNAPLVWELDDALSNPTCDEQYFLVGHMNRKKLIPSEVLKYVRNYCHELNLDGEIEDESFDLESFAAAILEKILEWKDQFYSKRIQQIMNLKSKTRIHELIKEMIELEYSVARLYFVDLLDTIDEVDTEE